MNDLRESVSMTQEFVWKLVDPALEFMLTSSLEHTVAAPSTQVCKPTLSDTNCRLIY